MAANMYRVGDYVYFENSSSNPYLIRRIEELNKRAAVAPSLELPSQKHLSSPGPGRGHLAVPHTASLPEAAFLDLEPCGHVA